MIIPLIKLKSDYSNSVSQVPLNFSKKFLKDDFTVFSVSLPDQINNQLII